MNQINGIGHGTSFELRQAMKKANGYIGIDLAHGSDLTTIGDDIYHNGVKVHYENGRMAETK